MKEMIYARQNEVEDVYQCPACQEFKRVPKGCDAPVCYCEEDKADEQEDKAIRAMEGSTYDYEEDEEESYVERFMEHEAKPCEDPNGYGCKISGHTEETIVFHVKEGALKGLSFKISPPYKCPSSYQINKEEFIKKYEREPTDREIWEKSWSVDILLNGFSISSHSGLSLAEAKRKVPCGATYKCIWRVFHGDKEKVDCGNLWCDKCDLFKEAPQ